MSADTGRVKISRFCSESEKQKEVFQETVIFCVKEKRQPSDDWKKYIVKSITLESGKRKLFLSKMILFMSR